jgi:hypothetical protein
MQIFSNDSANRTTSGVLSKAPRLALLVLAIVPGDGAVRRLGFDGLGVRGQQYRGHHAERAEPLRQGVGLHVAVIVLTGPHEAAVPFQRQRDHVVDQPVLVG